MQLASGLLLRHYAAVQDSARNVAQNARSETQAFAARFPAWQDVARFMQAFAVRHAIGEREYLRLVVVVEELFTNSVNHGYGGESDYPIELTLDADSEGVKIRYRDQAPPHDPFTKLDVSRRALDLPIEQRPVGQLGLVLINGFARTATYVREDGWNRIDIVLETVGDDAC